ncbi:MAG: glucose-6-phosphate isomerase [Bdellovibrionota bacterium]
MTEQSLWQRYCEFFRSYPELGFTLDISRMRFTDEFLAKMKPELERAFSEMHALESGEIVNPDEGRMVGHYWLRAPELAPNPELRSEIAASVERILAFTSKIHSGEIRSERKQTFRNLIVVGIGGSALGPQLVADALGAQQDKMRVLFCDNTDPDGIRRIVETLGSGLSETLVITISKSGGTIETRNGALEIAHAYREQGLTFAPHAVAVTCAKSKLDQQAISEGWLERIHMWDWVGGRTSLFSPVGLLPAALQGIDIQSFLDGAKEMDRITRVDDVSQNPAGLVALMWYFAGEGRGKKDMVVLPYKDRLTLFSKYLQQLVMESLGKEKNLKGEVVNQGIAVYGNKGSTDQHAYVQQLRDGLNNFFATFIAVLADYTTPAPAEAFEVEPGITSGDYLSGFLLGTRKALFENSRDSIMITMDELTPQTLGALIALYERAVGFYASLVGINAYHQPGVEAGKKAAARVIELQRAAVAELSKGKSASGVSAEELSAAVGAESDTETIYQILEHLAINRHSKVRRAGERHPQKARYWIAS